MNPKMDLIIIYLAIKYKNHFQSILNAIKNKEFVPLIKIEEIKNKVVTKKIKAINVMDDDYPESLKEIDNPPFVIFYECESNPLTKKETISLFNHKLPRMKTSKEVEEFIEKIVPGYASNSEYGKLISNEELEKALENTKDVKIYQINKNIIHIKLTN